MFSLSLTIMGMIRRSARAPVPAKHGPALASSVRVKMLQDGSAVLSNFLPHRDENGHKTVTG